MKLLLINLDPQNGSGEQLYQTLSNRDPLEIKHELLVESESSRIARHLSRLNASFRPDLVFLIFGSALRPRLAEVFEALRASRRSKPLIAVVNSGEPEEIQEALFHGAYDFLIPPFRADDVLPRIWRWADEVTPEDESVQALKEKLGLREVIGENEGFIAELKKIPIFAQSDAAVLIAGETGTGKEICVRALHNLSPRAAQTLVAVNCAAFHGELVENELFGHHSGAFTGANSSSLGVVQAAEGGTLFLDEINSLPLSAQSKLLRLLQEKEFRPVGSPKVCKADIRVIVASNSNLAEMVRGGLFREDLYYRLDALKLTMPALRDRPGDIPLLSRFFIAKFTTEPEKPAKQLTRAAIQKLVLYQWPGNVRELENVIQRTVVLSKSGIIQNDEILLPQSALASGPHSFQALKAIAVADFERRQINQLLAASEGNISEAARAADTDRRAFSRLMRKHEIDPPNPPPSNSP